MTVIAWDGTYLSSDGLMCDGDTICDTVFSKITHHKKQNIISACAGTVVDIMAFREWLDLGGFYDPQEHEFPEGLDNFEAFVFFMKGSKLSLCTFDSSRFAIPQSRVSAYAAIGSGGDFALGAFTMGADSAAAAQAACKHSTGCGGKIFTVCPYNLLRK